jgi:hypothetical protein
LLSLMHGTMNLKFAMNISDRIAVHQMCGTAAHVSSV